MCESRSFSGEIPLNGGIWTVKTVPWRGIFHMTISTSHVGYGRRCDESMKPPGWHIFPQVARWRKLLPGGPLFPTQSKISWKSFQKFLAFIFPKYQTVKNEPSRSTGHMKGWRLHPGRLTWNLQITHLERKMIFQTSMIMFQPLIFRGCTDHHVMPCSGWEVAEAIDPKEAEKLRLAGANGSGGSGVGWLVDCW